MRISGIEREIQEKLREPEIAKTAQFDQLTRDGIQEPLNSKYQKENPDDVGDG